MDDKINLEIDMLARKKIAAAKATKGKVCPKCGITQGLPKYGFEEFYCEHKTECIDLKYQGEFARIIGMAHNRN